MNDFTKEELELMRSWAVSKIDCVGLVDFVGTPERELQRKIISLIHLYDAQTIKVRHCEKVWACAMNDFTKEEPKEIKC